MHTAALFDLDGVIVDTESQYTRYWRGVGEEYFPDRPGFAEEIKGHTMAQILARYFGGDEAAQREVKKGLDRFEAGMDFPYVPGAVDFVRALRAAGERTAVVTSSDKAKMRCLYRRRPELPALFDRIFTAEDAVRSKPAPDCYIIAARHFGLEPGDCFVFEDSLSGLRAAKESGACVVGLTTTNPAERIRDYCAHVIADFTGFGVRHLLNLKKQ